MYAKANSSLRLSVRRYVKSIYYCTNLAHPLANELVYWERELVEYEQAADLS